MDASLVLAFEGFARRPALYSTFVDGDLAI
jgi:hypothetical protein